VQFIVEVEGDAGRSDFVRIEAASGALAVEEAKKAGHRVIALRTDDSLTGGIVLRDVDARELLENMSAEDRVRLGEGGGSLWLLAALEIARRLRWLIALAAVAAVGEYVMGGAFGWISVAALGLALTPLAGATFVTWFGPTRAHEAFHLAHFEGRWDDALHHLDALSAHLDDFTLAHMRAKVLGSQGAHAEALRTIEPYEGVVPDVAYASQVATILDRAHDYDGALRWSERALAAQPDNPMLLLELAQKRAVLAGDLAGAEAYLARLDRASLMPPMRFSVAWVEGVHALERKRYAEARARLEGAVAEVANLKPRAIYAGMLVVVRLFLAEAYARTGETELALGHLDATRPAATLHQLDILLDRVERALRGDELDYPVQKPEYDE
jgi:tetratricopeptide (TPR) repeat protein